MSSTRQADESALICSTAVIQNCMSKTTEKETLYSILGVSVDATVDEISSAYRKLAKLHHPDKQGDAEVFHKIQKAYEILSDAEKRKVYDSKPKDPDLEVETNFRRELFDEFVNGTVAEIDNNFKLMKKEKESAPNGVTIDPDPINPLFDLDLVQAKQGTTLYTLGNPLTFSHGAGEFCEITKDNLLHSYQPETIIKLFSSIRDAAVYARGQRIGDFCQGEASSQPTIVAVKLLQNVPPDTLLKKADVFVNESSGNFKTFGVSSHLFIELAAANVEPVSASSIIYSVRRNKQYETVFFPSKYHQKSIATYGVLAGAVISALGVGTSIFMRRTAYTSGATSLASLPKPNL